GSGSGLFNSRNVGVSSELSFPKFIDYSGIFSLMNTLRVIPDKRYEKLLETATTKMKVGFDYVSYVDFYDSYAAEAAFGYNIIPDDRWRIQFTQTGISYFNQDAKPAFDTILVTNPFFQNSFGPRLFTGFLMRDIQATFTDKNQKYGEDWSLRIFGEVSGMEELLFNVAISPNKEWRLRDTLEFAHFVKFELESQYTKAFSPKQSLALRGIVGVATPYGRFARTTPYVKQFFVGGPNSIRAWSIRQLGPGSYNDPQSSDPDNNLPFYQTGDIKMEASLEYRFDMFWYFEGAMFLDVGNVWLLEEDSRVGSSISKDFWRQFAVGTGFGLRLDFSYFIFRFDLGYPLRNNFPSATGRYWRNPQYNTFKEFRKDFNFNLAIGYPF
ncbi:MAG: BamA/TamA family outer membrane protein, partial [Saprospiraceae bacterium]